MWVSESPEVVAPPCSRTMKNAAMSLANRLKIEPNLWAADLSRSWGLPTHLYKGDEALEFDMLSIFRKEWLYLCPTDKLANKRDVVTGCAGDIPIVVTRAEDGELRGFVNACRHRGYQLVDRDRSKCHSLVCPYHVWSYRLNGALIQAPGSADESGFSKDDMGLLPIGVEVWGQGVFVNADAGAPSMTQSYPGINETAERIGMVLEPGQYRFHRETRHGAHANWKLWQDNFVECYHCANIHGTSFAAAYNSDIDAAETVFSDRFMSNRYPPSESSLSNELKVDKYRSMNFFPGRVYLQQRDLMIISQMRPTGPESTEQLTHFFVEDGADSDRVERWIELWDRTFREDCDAASVQQRVLRTGATTRNRLVPSREESLIHFNGWIIDSYRRQLALGVGAAAAE